MWVAALILATFACRNASDDVSESRLHALLRLPRIRIVVEVDLLGAQAPRIRAEAARYHTPRLP